MTSSDVPTRALRKTVLIGVKGCKLWQGSDGSHVLRFYKQFHVIRNVCNHFGNVFDGVKHKLEYRMRLAYAHFPFSANTFNGGKTLEIRNFLGEKSIM